jgi:hypothetical protein
MAQIKANKLYNTFVRGLITEASPLTYPENSTLDENNLVLSKKGNRTRRYGIDYSSTYTTLSEAQSGFTAKAISEFRWLAANNSSTSNFIVIQVGLTVYIYDFSGTQKTTIDITPYIISGVSTATAKAQQLTFASGNGFLFVAGRWTEPFVVTYNGSTFANAKLFVLIRDFIGVDDSTGPEVEPATLTVPHHYNLYNQGWIAPTGGGGSTVTYWTAFGAQSTFVQGGDDLINNYFSNVSKYPGNNKLWWWGTGANGGLSSNTLKNVAAGNIQAPRGHYIVNAFNIDRTAVSGLGSFTVETINERPTTVSYFAGRVWYGCQSTVYFSRVLTANKYYNANFCCMEADPTSQQISDLVATDGGTILIPDIGSITRLYPVGSGMLVFGTNGVSFIQGGTGGFSAVDFAVSKMSPIGMDAPNSVVEVDSQIFWMSYVGIQGMEQKSGIFGPIQGNFDKLNISLDTIQTYYTTNFPSSVRQNVKAVYDPSSNTIQWLFRSSAGAYAYSYDSVLNLDLYLQAFYPWKFTSSGPFVVGAIQNTSVNNISVGGTTRPTQVIFLTMVPNSSNYNLAYSQIQQTNFSDWHFYDSTGKAYSSYLETGFEILKDAERKKWLPYLFTYFRRTEQNLTTSDGGITYTADRPSSCTLTIKWDFSDSTLSGKWTTPIEAYRLQRIPFIDNSGGLTLDTGFSIVCSKHKIRGNGKSLQFRFETNQIGKDFDLLGWATEYTGTTVP